MFTKTRTARCETEAEAQRRRLEQSFLDFLDGRDDNVLPEPPALTDAPS